MTIMQLYCMWVLVAGLGIESSNHRAGEQNVGTLEWAVESISTGVVAAESIRAEQNPLDIHLERDIPQLPAPPEPKARPQREATIVFTGDMIPHGPVTRQAQAYGRVVGAEYDFSPMFGEVAGIVSDADLAICHMETPLSSTNSGISGYPIFNAPFQLAEAVADAGYDGCSLASNHSFDRGESGVLDTADVLDA